MMKGSPDNAGRSLKAPQCRQHPSLELFGAGDHLLSDPVVLGVVPNLLNGVDLRGIRRQKVKLQTTFRAFDKLLDRSTSMNRMAVHNEEDRPRLIMQQAPEKLDEALGIHRLFVEHETELAFRVNGVSETGPVACKKARPKGGCFSVRQLRPWERIEALASLAFLEPCQHRCQMSPKHRLEIPSRSSWGILGLFKDTRRPPCSTERTGA